MASNPHQPRAADRRKSSTPAPYPLALPGGTVIEKNRRAQDRRRYGFISRMELFRDVPYSAIEDTLASSPVREFQADTVFLRPGEENDSVFLVLEGRVRVHLDSDDSPHAIDIDPGGCIGEMSIIDGKPVSAFAVAEAGSRILEIDQSRFWSNIVAHPRAMRNLLGVLAERMRRSARAVLKGMQDRLMLEHIHKELKLAREIQQSMLPGISRLAPVAARVDLHAAIEPARAVGGDLYDFFVTPAGALCFLVGDVSGKGVPAALFMARTVDIVRVVTRLAGAGGPGEPDPAWILSQVNGELCENNESRMFVTLFLAVLDPRNGRMDYCNAGHPAPYLYSADGGLAPLNGPRSAPLGVTHGTAYQNRSMVLRGHDALFVFTDGVTEAENEAGFFGEERLESVLRAASGTTAQGLNASVLEAVRGFMGKGPPSDDITTLTVRLLA